MESTHRSVAVFGLVAILASPLATLGDKQLGSVQKIKAWGYSIKTVEEWSAVAPEPDEKYVVGRWKPDLKDSQKRGDFQGMMDGQFCELTVIRLVPEASTTGPGTETPVAEKSPEEKMRERFTAAMGRGRSSEAKSAEQWIENVYEGAGARATKKPLKIGDTTATLWDFTHSQTHYLIAVIKRDGLEWAFTYGAHEEVFTRDYVKVFTQSLQSIRFFAPEGKPDAAAANADFTKLEGKERREAIKAKIAGLTGWYAVDTKNYVFLTNAKDKAFINLLGRELETIREKMYEKIFPATKPIETISIVRVLATQDEYHQYGGPGGSAGYWNSKDEELVLFIEFTSLARKLSKAYCKSVMYHEGFHQYIHYASGDFAPHSWFNEGHGDYFAGSIVTPNSVSVKPFEWRVEALKRHIGEKKDLIPTKSLVRLPQGEYYTNGGLKYAHGWAIVYFLRSVTKNARYKEIPGIYFQHLRDNMELLKSETEASGGDDIPGLPGVVSARYRDPEKAEKILMEAIDKAFEGIDMEKFDKEFHGWVRTL